MKNQPFKKIVKYIKKLPIFKKKKKKISNKGKEAKTV